MATAPSEEEFKAWKDHPTTQWVLGAYRIMAEAQKQHWVDLTWEGGNCDSFELCTLRTRADAYMSMHQCDLSDFAAAHEPEAE